MSLATSALRHCALTTGLALASGAAISAEIASFGIPPAATGVFLGAANNVGAVVFPNSSDPAFRMTFVLPQDYVRSATVNIVFAMGVIGTTPCSVRFAPESLVRTRPGLAQLSSLTGLNDEDGSGLVHFSSNAIVEKTFNLTRNPAFPGGQRAGDTFRVGFQRLSNDASDICLGSALIHSIDIRYPRVP